MVGLLRRRKCTCIVELYLWLHFISVAARWSVVTESRMSILRGGEIGAGRHVSGVCGVRMVSSSEYEGRQDDGSVGW